MAGLSIEQPGVEVEQEFVAESPTLVTPAQQAVFVGPCFQIVSAFDDDGLPLADALAGTYRDGFGVIAYPLPGLLDGAKLDGFLDQIRVFLLLGSQKRELRSVYAETDVYAGTDGTISGADESAAILTDPGVNFVNEGVIEDDVVRVSYQGESYDLRITAVSATELALDEDDITRLLGPTGLGSAIDIDFDDYEIVRDAAEFEYVVSASQARFTLGSDADYLTLRVKADADDAYLGGGGDGIVVTVLQQPAYLEDADCYVGANIFWTATPGTDFTADIGAVGAVDDHFLFLGAVGAGNALREVLRVVSEQILIIEDGATANVSASNYTVGELIDSGADGATDGGDEQVFTSAGGGFQTSITRVDPGVDDSPATDTYIEIAGVGVFQVTEVTSDTALAISAGAGTGLAGQAFSIIEDRRTEAGAGATGKDNSGGQTTVCFGGGELTTDLLTGRAVITEGDEWEGGAYANQPAGAHLAGYLVNVTADLTAAATAQAAEIVDVDTDLVLTWNESQGQLLVLAGRGSDGLSTGGFKDPGASGGVYLHEALTDDEDPAYNVAVAAIFESVVTGDPSALTFDEGPIRTGQVTFTLDGGAAEGDLLVDQDLLGSQTPTALVYVSFKALRTDVWLEIGDPTQIPTKLGPYGGNPLAIAALYGLLASPSDPIRVLGVGAVSAAKPQGTEVAYAEAFAFLESKKVYAIAPLTQDPVVGQALQAHVNDMSEPEQKAERIGLINSQMPTHTQADVLASGTTGNGGTGAGGTPSKMSGIAQAEFRTSVDFSLVDVQAGDILVVSARSGAASYLEAVDGTVGPLYGIPVIDVKPTDDFVLRVNGTSLPSTWDDLIDVTWTLYRAGEEISEPADQAEAIAKLAEGYADRRIIHIWPDALTGPVDGAESVLEGYYAAASVAALIGAKGAADPLTNTNVPGYTAVRHSSGYFTRRQLNRMAGGGNFILIQDADGQPVKIRHQLSTDTSTIERREISVTTANDLIADVYRSTLGPQIGRVNISDNLLTDLAAKSEALNASLIDQKVARNIELLSISEDEARADTVVFEVGVRNFIPNNYNRVKILVGAV